MTVTIARQDPIATVILSRPGQRNAVDRATATALAQAFLELDRDPAIRAMVLYGADGAFCAGADLKAIASGQGNQIVPPSGADDDPTGPMGPSRMILTKPVIAAIAGPAVAGGLELALWCDLRVVEQGSVLGVFCRRFGVPLIDGGTVRLPRLIGLSRALDLILTGRAVEAEEALAMGLANRVVPPGQARAAAEALAHDLAALPPICLRNDRRAAYDQDGLSLADALTREYVLGLDTLRAGEAVIGATRFTEGQGRSGQKLGHD